MRYLIKNRIMKWTELENTNSSDFLKLNRKINED